MKTKLFHPYETEKYQIKIGKKTYIGAKCNLQKTGAGVYFIYENGKLAYIGFSGTDVKKTMYRHFQKWNDLRHPENKRRDRIERVSYFEGFKNADFKCRVIFCKNAAQAARFEIALIKKFKPRDNSLKMDFDSMVEYTKTLKEIDKAAEVAAPLEDAPF